MPYRCRLCGGTYCADHRLPENHDCPGLENWDDPSGVFDSGFDDGVDQSGRSRAGSVAERVGLDTGPGGPLSYFRGNVTFVLLGLMWVTFLAEWLVLLSAGPGAFETIFVLRSDAITRVWTWLTSVFSHSPANFFHILFNSIVLYFFGPVVEDRVGSKRFVGLFLISGVLAGLAQVGTALVLGEGATGVLGASGAIAAVMGVLTVLRPNLRIYLYFVIPMPLWIATLLFAGWSVVASSAGGIGAGNVAQIAHLAGLGVGLLYGLKLKREGRRAPEELQFGGGPGGPGMGGRGRF